jgi:hypothetical protein
MTVSADDLERRWTEPPIGRRSGGKSPPLLIPWSVWADRGPTGTMVWMWTKVSAGAHAIGRLIVRGLKAYVEAARWEDSYLHDYADFHPNEARPVDHVADRGLPEASWHL